MNDLRHETPKTYVVKTLGCKANFYDSQLIEAELQKRGWLPHDPTKSPIEPSLCVVNSCTVTDEADRQSRKMASRLSRDNPEAMVVVTGCAAEVDPERLAASRGIHYVIGNRDKPQLVRLILEKVEQGRSAESQAPTTGSVLGRAEGYEEILSRHPMDREWPGEEESFVTPPTHLDGHTGKTRAFLKIQEGCNAFCTYCIIPYGRGPSRSLRPREVITQVRELVDQGIREVVITGTNIGDYGTDWDAAPQLTSLLKMILSETGVERLRVGSLDPTEIPAEMLDLMAQEPRFCPHFHVSLQSPNSRILRLMKRKYASAEVERCLRAIDAIGNVRPLPGGVFVGMDVITGFPGETEEEFEQGLRMLESLPWTRLHVFPYSERQGTPATRLPGAVPQEERVRRTRRLNELSLSRMRAVHENALSSLLEQRLSLEGILLERVNRAPGSGESMILGEEARKRVDSTDRWVAGYTPNYLRVFLPAAIGLERNDLASARPLGLVIDSQNGDVALIAEALSS